SGSMSGSPKRKAIAAAHKFVRMLPEARYAVIAYADRTKVLCSDCPSSKVGTFIDALGTTNVGGCNGAHPFKDILRLNPGSKYKVFEITLTDGLWSCCDDAEETAKACMNEGIECIAVGFGSADHAFLKRISSMDEGALMSSVDGLESTFSTIASSISSGGSRFIR
ncbi:MAG: VWA domain-containing protein, partial [Candidatus Methanomethylophilaceae archaeon]|nr:VWA domain-containing protein [Candidatus Methanomethylophilaceae archaeon]